MIKTDEINGAVKSFQDTVAALKRIETISEKTSEQLDSIKSSTASIGTATSEIVEHAGKLASHSDGLKACVEDAKASNTQNTAVVMKIMQEMTGEVTNNMKKEIESIDGLRESVRSYTLSTQNSVDEFRINQNRIASEIRESVADTKLTLKDEISKVSQSVNTLSEKVSSLSDKQQKDHTLMIVGVILVAIASVTSIVGLFL